MRAHSLTFTELNFTLSEIRNYLRFKRDSVPALLLLSTAPSPFMMWRMYKLLIISTAETELAWELPVKAWQANSEISRLKFLHCLYNSHYCKWRWSLAGGVRQELTSATIYHWNKRRSLNSLNHFTNKNSRPAVPGWQCEARRECVVPSLSVHHGM